jgi:hypothetical protein
MRGARGGVGELERVLEADEDAELFEIANNSSSDVGCRMSSTYIELRFLRFTGLV